MLQQDQICVLGVVVRYATSFMSNIKKDMGTGLCTLVAR